MGELSKNTSNIQIPSQILIGPNCSSKSEEKSLQRVVYDLGDWWFHKTYCERHHLIAIPVTRRDTEAEARLSFCFPCSNSWSVLRFIDETMVEKQFPGDYASSQESKSECKLLRYHRVTWCWISFLVERASCSLRTLPMPHPLNSKSAPFSLQVSGDYCIGLYSSAPRKENPLVLSRKSGGHTARARAYFAGIDQVPSEMRISWRFYFTATQNG